MNKHIITKEEFDKLCGDNVLKREYDAIIEKIDKRFVEIMDNLTLPESFDSDLYKESIYVNASGTEFSIKEIPSRGCGNQHIKMSTTKWLKRNGKKTTK